MDTQGLKDLVAAIEPVAMPLTLCVVAICLTIVLVVVLLRNKNVTTPVGSISQPIANEQRELQKSEPPVLPEPTKALAQIEANIRSDLENNPEPMKRLVRELAITRVRLYSEGVYTNIFGSQIKLLQLIRDKGGSITLTATKRHFQAAKQEFPHAFGAWALETYLQYLISNGLISVEGDKVLLSDLARDFLMVIEHEKPPNSKML